MKSVNTTIATIQITHRISKWNDCNIYISLVLSTGDDKAYFEYNQLRSKHYLETSYISCGSGPHYKNYYKPGYLYWPTIRYKSCDGLICDGMGCDDGFIFKHSSRCSSTYSIIKHTQACVYSCTKNRCNYIGNRSITYVEHLQCKCNPTIIIDCLRGYRWDPRQCKCIRYCPTMTYYDSNLYKCVPEDYIDGSTLDYPINPEWS